MNKDGLKNMLIVSITTTLMGQVYINPFDSPFRLSMGIAILTFLLLQFDDIPIMMTTNLTAVNVFIFRFTIDIVQFNNFINLGINGIASKHLPSAVFYIVFGIALSQLRIRRYREQPIFLIFLVGISDIFSNIAEAAVRQEFTVHTIDVILTSLFIAGFVRATIAFILHSSLKAYNMLIIREEHERRYMNLLLFTANMKAELFLLTKTMQDIEQAMVRCYSIYSELKTKNDIHLNYIDNLKNRILNLAKDIHEIKKDNQRVVSGIEKLLPQAEKDNVMKISAILKILKDNTDRYIQSLGKNIRFLVDTYNDVYINDYYPLITILNNLINNSIDSIDNEGYIKISYKIKENHLVVNVLDSGSGIKEEDIDVIFEPGFSTKFDKRTGHMSTGIGLTHVKHIVENHYRGKIEVNSDRGGTRFTVYIPVNKIMDKED